MRRPDLAAVRVRLVQESLAGRDGELERRMPTVVSTGRVGSGKSSLGNRMLGSRHLLRATGHVDCTDRAQVVRFPCGLRYVDLPGVASNDAFENLNRMALGIPMVPEWPTPAALPIDVCTPDGAVESAEHPGAPFADADVVFYLLAAHQQFGYDDRRYLADLRAARPARPVLFVLNHFSDPATGARRATPQNVADMIAAVGDTWGGVPDLVEIDCRTGEGLDRLLARTEQVLGAERGAPLAQAVDRQLREAPARYAKDVRAYVSARLAELAPVAASSEREASDRLSAELLDVLDLALHGPARDALAPEITPCVAAIVTGLRKEVTRPVMKTVEKPVYENVPVHKTVKETDYDKPKYNSEPVYEWRTEYEDVDYLSEVIEGLGNLVSGKGLTVARRKKVLVGHRDVLVGYGKSKREVFSHTERRLVRVEKGQEQVGVEVVDVAFAPFGPPAAAAGVAVCGRAIGRGTRLQAEADRVASALGVALKKAPDVAAAVRVTLDREVGAAFDTAVATTAQERAG